MEPETLLSIVNSLPYPQLALPVISGVVALVVALVLRIPLAFALVLMAVPYLIPDISSYVVVPEAVAGSGLAPMVIGWYGIGALIFGRGLALLFSSSSKGAGFVGGFSLLASIVCGGFVLLSYMDPALVQRYSTYWSGGYGAALIGLTLIGFALSIFRFLRASVVILFWGAVTFMIGNKIEGGAYMTEAVEIADSISDVLVVPGSVNPRFLNGEGVEGDRGESSGAGRRIAILGGTAELAPYLENSSAYSSKLEGLMKEEDPEFSVVNYSVPGITFTQMAKTLKEELLPAKPEFVVFSGWSEEIFDRGFEPEEFRKIISSFVGTIIDSGSTPVVIPQPFENSSETGRTPEYLQYKKVVKDVADSEGAVFVDLEQTLRARKFDLLFLKDQILSEQGHKVVASRVYEAIIGSGIV